MTSGSKKSIVSMNLLAHRYDLPTWFVAIRVALTISIASWFCVGPTMAGEPETPAVGMDVRLEWTDCGIPERRFFSATISRQGHLEYKGSQYVRDRGTRQMRISVSDAAAVVSAASKISRRRIRDIRDQESELIGVRGAYCVRASKIDRGELLTSGSVSTKLPADARLVQEIEKVVAAKRWICPVRAAGLGSAFSQAPYCDDPVIRIQLGEPSACASSRSIDIFEDGTIRQIATQAYTDDEGYAVFVPIGTSFVNVNGEAVSNLVDLAKSYVALPDMLDESNPDYPYTRRGNGGDIARFRTALEAIAGMKWIAISKPAVQCGADQAVPDSLRVAR